MKKTFSLILIFSLLFSSVCAAGVFPAGAAHHTGTKYVDYIVAVGSGSGTFLNGADWDPEDERNVMTEVSEGAYEIFFKGVKSGTYQFKFVANSIGADNPYEICWGKNQKSNQAVLNGDSINISVREDNSMVKLRLDLSYYNYDTDQYAYYYVIESPQNDIDKRKLQLYVNYYKQRYKMFGKDEAYEQQPLHRAFDSAKAVLDDASSTSEDYREAYENAKNTMYSLNVFPNYARKACEKASKLKNTIYPEDEWNNFQNAISALRNAIVDNEGVSHERSDIIEETREYITVPVYIYNDEQRKEITRCFHEMLYAYNSMADRHNIMGDVNQDGKVDIMDAVRIQKGIATAAPIQSLEYRLIDTQRYHAAGDINNDGYVDVLDAVEIQKYAAGKIQELRPYESFISKVNTYESDEFMRAHLLNYDICPVLGDQLFVMLDKEECISMEFQNIYAKFDEEEIEF